MIFAIEFAYPDVDMNVQEHTPGADPVLGFKLALNELMRFPNLSGGEAIDKARRAQGVSPTASAAEPPTQRVGTCRLCGKCVLCA